MSEIKQGNNICDVIGYLKEKKLEIKTTKREGQPAVAITGELIVQTSEHESTTLKVFSYEKTKKGEVSKAFHSLKTCMEEYASLADGGDADIVNVKKGGFDVNEYHGQNGLVSRPQCSANFISRANNLSEENFKSEFSVDVYVVNVRPEIKSEEETGRLLVDCLLPMYGGKVAPLQLVTPSEGEAFDFVDSEIEAGVTTTFFGDIVSKAIVHEKKIGGFGKQKIETTTDYVNELIITGGTGIIFTEDDEQGYKKADMANAMKEREVRLEEMKQNQGKNKPATGAKPTGFGKGASKPAGKAKGDDIPF